MELQTLIDTGYYVSSLGFFIATVITALAAKKFGKSSLGSVFSYLFIGTGIFFVITIFQKLGANFFGITDPSMDIWWHIMFYMALTSYFFGFKSLVRLGSAESETKVGAIGAEKLWGGFSLVALVIIFIIPHWAEPVVQTYTSSVFADFGLHHFIAFLLAGIVGYYLLNAKKNIGQIGRAIANPMIIAIWALGIQHFWELLNESWKVVIVTSDVGEGVEKIFLTIASIAIIFAALRLKAAAQPK